MNRFIRVVCLFLIFCANFLSAAIDFDKKSDESEFFVQVDGAEIFCKMIGKGDPIVVIQGGPGIPFDGWVYSAISKLSETNLVLFFDHRGSSRSTGEVNPETMSFDVFVNDLECMRKSLGFKKMSLIGECWGGALSMKYAITYPEYVDKLILLNTLGPAVEDFIVPMTEFKSRLAPYKKEMFSIKDSEEFIAGDAEAVNRYYKLSLIPHFYNQNYTDFLAVTQPISLETLKARQLMIKTFFKAEYSKYFSWYSQLEKLESPTLIVHGDSDWNPYVIAQRIHKTISNSQFVLLKDCGHLTMIEKPDEVFQVVRDFFDKN